MISDSCDGQSAARIKEQESRSRVEEAPPSTRYSSGLNESTIAFPSNGPSGGLADLHGS